MYSDSVSAVRSNNPTMNSALPSRQITHETSSAQLHNGGNLGPAVSSPAHLAQPALSRRSLSLDTAFASVCDDRPTPIKQFRTTSLPSVSQRREESLKQPAPVSRQLEVPEASSTTANHLSRTPSESSARSTTPTPPAGFISAADQHGSTYFPSNDIERRTGSPSSLDVSDAGQSDRSVTPTASQINHSSPTRSTETSISARAASDLRQQVFAQMEEARTSARAASGVRQYVFAQTEPLLKELRTIANTPYDLQSLADKLESWRGNATMVSRHLRETLPAATVSVRGSDGHQTPH